MPNFEPYCRCPGCGECEAHQNRRYHKDEIKRLRADLARVTAERDELRAARFAYAKEFPLDAEGEPDVGNIHANIRAIKKELDEARKDAERYRWLRDQMWAQHQTGRYYLPIAWAEDADKSNAGDNMDAAIDAAKEDA